jgi:hypothetical protein
MKRTAKTVLNFLIGVFILFTCAMIYINIRAIWDPGYTPPVGKFLLIGPTAHEDWMAVEGLGMLRGPGGFVVVTIVILLIIILYEIINIIREIKAAEKSKKLSARVKKIDFNKKRSYSK